MNTTEYTLISNDETVTVYTEDLKHARNLLEELAKADSPTRLRRQYPELRDRAISMCALDVVLSPPDSYEHPFVTDEFILTACRYHTEQRLLCPEHETVAKIHEQIDQALHSLGRYES